MLVSSSTFSSFIRNSERNSPKRSELDSSWVISCVNPGQRKLTYHGDSRTLCFFRRRQNWPFRTQLLTENEHESLSYPPMSGESPASSKLKSLLNPNDLPKLGAGKNSDRKSKAGRASPAGGWFMVSRTPTGMSRREREEERGGISPES